MEGRDMNNVVTHTGYLGYTSACYKGNPWKARRQLKNMAMDDGEKSNIRVWFDQKNKEIDFYFVDTKCMDDSLDATESECSVEVIIPKCKK
jgi:hypothetical protein